MKNIHILPTDKPSRLAFDTDENFYLLCEEPVFFKHQELVENRNIYITSSEELPYDDSIFATGAFYHRDAAKDIHIITKDTFHPNPNFCSRIILTTNDSLFKYGVQAIDDEFLEWFVKNPSCEFVEIDKGYRGVDLFNYKIIIPQEEPKQEKEEEYFKHLEKDKKEFAKEWEEIRQEFLLFDKERANTITSEGQKTVRELQNTIQQETLEEAAENESEYLADWEDKSMYVRGFVDGAKYQAERMYAEADNIMRFLDTEVELKLSDTKTIERIKWYFKTYFEQFKKK